jgi:hypothetical protein
MPVTFAGHSAQLSSRGRDALGMYAELRCDKKRCDNRLLVIFYGGVPTRVPAKNLQHERRRAVHSYLIASGVPEEAISIIVSKVPPPTYLHYEGKTLAPASVELTTGCGD